MNFSLCNAQDKSAKRYEIDAKRHGVYPGDKDALPRSREFIRLDSTYYVGWMYEGLYKYERSADYLGYRNAIVPLSKALNLLEKDFGTKLKNLFSSFGYFQQHFGLYDDFYKIAEALKTSYNSIEMPDSTMALLDRIDSYKFQKDYFSVKTEKAWTFHRNRFYSSDKFSFLKNSIEENEKMAFKYCYEQIADIERNRNMNDAWYGQGQSEDDLLTVYHYLALLHDYNRNYDSSEYYYKIQIDGGRVSWGNYAHLQTELGNFSEAIYCFSKGYYRRKQTLSEPDYYLPSLFIYGGRTKDAINLAQQRIAQNGSTPGFGWYNMALARGYLYDGQLDSCGFYLDKAANFKELHIGTTLTQSQYDFTINLLKIQMLDKKIQLVKFFNTGWWYSPGDLYQVAMLQLEKLILEYSAVNALAFNPERKRIIYDLFCGESTVTFDESMYLMKEFSLPFFQEMYEAYQENDRRQKIRRYFKMFAARFKYERGNEEEAARDCREILNAGYFNRGLPGETIDRENEKLLLARLFEIIAMGNEGDDQSIAMSNYFEVFPQLIPFSGLTMKINARFSGIEDNNTLQVIKDIKSCNINFVSEPDNAIPEAEIQFVKKGALYQVIISVKSGTGRDIVSSQQLIFKNPDGIGKELALRLFGKGGAIKFDKAKVKENV